ncbi:MAG: alpha/beta fold hydrolase [Hyphomicrobiaceae bacterium]|nr:alpha/beta fold hydrolase [Hyphomicrobiaceae bacterium]
MAKPPPTSLAEMPIRLHRKGNGAALLLLHCLGVDHALWDLAAAGLDDKFTLLSYDFPGHGEAAVPDHPYTIADLSHQLAGVLEREGLTRTHVAGISLGGLVAQHFAANHPQLVDRLVLIDTTPRYVEEARQMWVERARAARTAGVASLTDGLLKIWFTDDFVANNPPAVAYVRDRFAKASGEGYALACEALGAADLRPLAARIRAPTLIFCGSEELAPFKEAARWLMQNIQGAELAWLSPARHASVLEQPRAFVDRARAFLLS